MYPSICSHSDLKPTPLKGLAENFSRLLPLGGGYQSARDWPLGPSPTSDDLADFARVVEGDDQREGGRFWGPFPQL